MYQPWQRLLLAAAGAGSRPHDHSAARPTAPGVPFRRLADVARLAGRRGRGQDRPPSCEDANAADGDGSALSPSAHDQARTRAQDLSVSAARRRDHATEPGVGDGHHLYPDGARLRLSGRRARLVQPSRAVVERIDHDGRRHSCVETLESAFWLVMAGRTFSTPIRAASSPARHSLACLRSKTASPSAWTARGGFGATMSSSSGCGVASSTRRFISEPMTAHPRRAYRSGATSTSTIVRGRIRAF